MTLSAGLTWPRCYGNKAQGDRWIQQFRGKGSQFACLLGFTETGLIPGISAAGATPADREWTAIADAEFLYHGPQPSPQFPLPPLTAGASPTLISRAVVEGCTLPLHLFNAGLRHAPTVPCVDLGGAPARCVSTGAALELQTVLRLLHAGLDWGDRLAQAQPEAYLLIGECVVGGTTTALSVLTGLGIAAAGKVNSSHPICNHTQKWDIVSAGLSRAVEQGRLSRENPDPLAVVAAVGDPMQIAVAGMAIAASQVTGVLLAGGTQMLAVYALMQALQRHHGLHWNPERVAVGTTRWVAEDPTGDTAGLATDLHAPLLATPLSFAESRYASLRAYEQGYVKEGVGAGGCAIAAHLLGWHNADLLSAVEAMLRRAGKEN